MLSRDRAPASISSATRLGAPLRFLAARSTRDVELVRDDAYLRTVRLGDFIGWFRARNAADAHAIVVDRSTSLATTTDALTTRLRHLFDLDARPDLIDAHFANDALLGDPTRRRPGLRVPGAPGPPPPAIFISPPIIFDMFGSIFIESIPPVGIEPPITDPIVDMPCFSML
ncbi:MAG: AlkA N-terminal domain-containing protein [Gemmatimonadaceae bacterium]